MPNRALQTLLEAEERRRDDAATVVRHCAQAWQRAQAQAEQLLGFEAEYRARWSPQALGSTPMPQVHEYTRFMQRLTDARTQQASQVQAAQARLVEAQTALRERETRLAGVRKLLQRRHGEALRRSQMREQKQMDEFAQRPRSPLHPPDPPTDTAFQELVP